MGINGSQDAKMDIGVTPFAQTLVPAEVIDHVLGFVEARHVLCATLTCKQVYSRALVVHSDGSSKCSNNDDAAHMCLPDQSVLGFMVSEAMREYARDKLGLMARSEEEQRSMLWYLSKRGRLESVTWLRAQDPPYEWDSRVCFWAAENGHLEVLQWARAQDPPCPLYDD